MRAARGIFNAEKEKAGSPLSRCAIDWEQPANNDFLLVSQFSVTGALYTCRADLVGFVNGLPLVVIELKRPGVPARAAFDENLTHYKAEIPQLFWFNARLIASNGTDSRVGSLTVNWELLATRRAVVLALRIWARLDARSRSGAHWRRSGGRRSDLVRAK